MKKAYGMKYIYREATAEKALVIYSPGSGRSAQFSQALQAIQESGIEIVEQLSIIDLSGLEPQGEIWRARGITLVIAAGGDGLLGGIIAHIAKSKLPLGILPLGTANDIARSVDIPLDVNKAVETLKSRKLMEIDLGFGSWQEAASEKQALFVHALTAGINVQFARMATDATLRQKHGSLMYPVALMEAIRNYQPTQVTITLEGLWLPETRTLASQALTLRCKVAQATVVNAPVFWGFLNAIVPGVSLSDRLLDIVVIEDEPLELIMWRLSGFFNNELQQRPTSQGWHGRYPELLSAQLTNIQGIHHFKAQRVIIDVEDGSEDTAMDGEVVGKTPIIAAVADEQVRLVVPEAVTQSQDWWA